MLPAKWCTTQLFCYAILVLSMNTIHCSFAIFPLKSEILRNLKYLMLLNWILIRTQMFEFSYLHSHVSKHMFAWSKGNLTPVYMVDVRYITCAPRLCYSTCRFPKNIMVSLGNHVSTTHVHSAYLDSSTSTRSARVINDAQAPVINVSTTCHKRYASTCH